VVQGIDAGADDYRTKPFDPQELQVRLRAGRRILDLERDLLATVRELAEVRRREYEVGARIQQMLLLGRPPDGMAGIEVAALTAPSQQIDGDFYDFYPYGGDRLDLVVGDVMGKGVPAAVLGAAIKSRFARVIGDLLGPCEPG